MPSTHGKALRFLVTAGGMGDQAGGGPDEGGGPGEGGGAIWAELKAIVAWGGLVSRVCGYWIVALGSEGAGPPALSSGEPSSRQKLRASSA
jgi:hypothetical protein